MQTIIFGIKTNITVKTTLKNSNFDQIFTIFVVNFVGTIVI
jgi:hypothetical protein